MVDKEQVTVVKDSMPTWEKLLGLARVAVSEKDFVQPDIKAIDKIWDDELDLTRHTLVDLYFKQTGKKLPWYDLKKPLFDDEIITKLSEYADQSDIPFDLMKNLIFATTKNKHFSNPKVLRAALEKSLTQQWLHIDAIRELENDN